jgi:hypothetical protein
MIQTHCCTSTATAEGEEKVFMCRTDVGGMLNLSEPVVYVTLRQIGFQHAAPLSTVYSN